MKHALAILLLSAGLAHANGKPSELQGVVNADEPVGCAAFTFLFWDLYDGELWTDAPIPPGDIHALALTYKSDFTAEELVESTIEEMSRISGRDAADLGDAKAELDAIFPSVIEGDRLTAARLSADRLTFFYNGKDVGTQTIDVDLLMSIWLGPDSRDQDGRAALLGGGCG